MLLSRGSERRLLAVLLFAALPVQAQQPSPELPVERRELSPEVRRRFAALVRTTQEVWARHLQAQKEFDALRARHEAEEKRIKERLAKLSTLREQVLAANARIDPLMLEVEKSTQRVEAVRQGSAHPRELARVEAELVQVRKRALEQYDEAKRLNKELLALDGQLKGERRAFTQLAEEAGKARQRLHTIELQMELGLDAAFNLREQP